MSYAPDACGAVRAACVLDLAGLDAWVPVRQTVEVPDDLPYFLHRGGEDGAVIDSWHVRFLLRM
jgi:hypothetical protein